LGYVLRIRVIAMSHSKISTVIFTTFLALSTVVPVKAAPALLAPGANDGSIAYITARLLEEFHYTQHPFDTDISKRFYSSYLDVYDPEHLYFLQSDIAEFSRYETNLDTLTLGPHGQAIHVPAAQHRLPRGRLGEVALVAQCGNCARQLGRGRDVAADEPAGDQHRRH